MPENTVTIGLDEYNQLFKDSIMLDFIRDIFDNSPSWGVESRVRELMHWEKEEVNKDDFI